jgi:hypothetical protein
MYQVPGMILIAQTKNMGCWYASAQMLIQWKRAREMATLEGQSDPSEVAQVVQWEVANNGVINPRILNLAKFLGLRSIPPMSVTLPELEGYLRRYGPLWTNGKAHIVVIAGVDPAAQKVLVYDPWPQGKGRIEWRSFPGWYLGNAPMAPGDPDSSRDIGSDVEATFLYHP